MYEEFLKQIEDFMFIEDKPEKADVIFVPGNGYPQMAEKAAELYRNGFAPKILPSGRYSITAGRFTGVLDKKECYCGTHNTNSQRIPYPDKATCNTSTHVLHDRFYSRESPF